MHRAQSCTCSVSIDEDCTEDGKGIGAKGCSAESSGEEENGSKEESSNQEGSGTDHIFH